MSALDKFWPLQSDVNHCIRTEAETTEEAVLLAVHEPGRLHRRESNGHDEGEKEEADLLKALMTSTDDTGSSVIVAITGPSGFGKSHLIRWLHAQLLRHPRRRDLVVVLIPKTASLRQVVERILEPLEGEEYDKLRSALTQSIDRMSVEDAAQHLATALAIQLEQREKEWTAQIFEGGLRNDASLRSNATHAASVRGFLRAERVLDTWFGAVLRRIVGQVIGGSDGSGETTQRNFCAADFECPTDFSEGDLAISVHRLVIKLQGTAMLRETVAIMLNEHALDPALRQIFQFSTSLGQKSIDSIVGDIRTQLQHQSKELVLLIEDLAAMAGIQQPLKSLLMAERNSTLQPDGTKKWTSSPLRSAIAVTDGFLLTNDSIFTRAKHEWVIPRASRDQATTIERLVNMTGRYLNAARWGRDALVDQLTQTNVQDDLSLGHWVADFSTAPPHLATPELEAFGRASNGFSLFPFNRLAIESLARRFVKVAGTSGEVIEFNPRRFINAVLRATLLMRNEFEAGRFPPPDWTGAIPLPAVRQAISRLVIPEETRQRLYPAVVYWGGNPGSLDNETTTAAAVFTAFGLPDPFTRGIEPSNRPSTEPASPPVGGQPGTIAKVAPKEDPAARYVDVISAWTKGTTLPQETAKFIRNLIAAELTAHINFGLLRIAPAEVDPSWIFLPGVRTGNPTREPMLRVAAPKEHSYVETAFLGLIRHQAAPKWDYPRAELDYADAARLLNDLLASAEEILLAQSRQGIGQLATALHRQALFFQLTGKHELGDVLPGDVLRPIQEDWQQNSDFPQIRNAITSNMALRKTFAVTAGCYQGDDGALLAIDPDRLRSALLETETDGIWRKLPEEVRDTVRDFTTNAEAFVRSYASVVGSYRTVIDQSIAVDDSLHQLCAELRRTFEAAKALGVLRVVPPTADISVTLETLESAESSTTIRLAFAFSEPTKDAPIGTRMHAWGGLSHGHMNTVADALTVCSGTLKETQRALLAALDTMGGADARVLFDKLIKSLRWETPQ